jgi:hypothetical protein
VILIDFSIIILITPIGKINNKKGPERPFLCAIDYTTGVYSIPVVARPVNPIVVSNAANSLAATNTSA